MKKTFLLTLCCMTSLSFAKTFYVEISRANSAPSVENIVFESQLSPPPPNYSLDAFNSVAPEKVDYLIKIRATGNLKTIMENHPNWARAKLQQFIVTTYPDNANSTAIQTAYDNDGNVGFAYEINENDLPSLDTPFPTIEQLKKYKKTTTKSSSIPSLIPLVNKNSADVLGTSWQTHC